MLIFVSRPRGARGPSHYAIEYDPTTIATEARRAETTGSVADEGAGRQTSPNNQEEGSQ